MQKLGRSFYNRNTEIVAKDLLGKWLVHYDPDVNIERIGRIVEVEAYLGSHDLAAHASKGITKRTEVMFGPPGYAYIYLIYGLHHCLNVVTEEVGNGCAVLLRAIEPIKNIEINTKGPGLLCKAMQIDKSLNGQDLLGDRLYLIEPKKEEQFDIVERPRIGVHYAKEWANRLLRFYIRDNSFVSKR